MEEKIISREERITDVETKGNITTFKFGRNRCSLESEVYDDNTEGYILKYREVVVEWGRVNGKPFKIIPPTFNGKRRFIEAFRKYFGYDLNKISKEYPED